MPSFTIIDLLDTTPTGPEATGPDDEPQAVFLRQGDADGACGPYSLLMALLICGLIDRENIDYFARLDRKTNYGKLMARLDEHGGLFRNGTSLDELVDVVEGVFTRRLRFEQSDADGVRVRSFACEHVAASHPVILGLEFVDGAHWVVVVGTEHNADGSVRRLLLLDPSGPVPAGCAWNGAIEAYGQGGPYPYEYWWPGDAELSRVRLCQALALWPRSR